MAYGFRIRHKENSGEYWNSAQKKWVPFAEATRFANKAGVAKPTEGEWVDMGATYKEVEEARRALWQHSLKCHAVLKAHKLLKSLDEYDLGDDLNSELQDISQSLGRWVGKFRKIVKEAPPELRL